MPDYGRAEARDWAREHMVGVAGCTLPTLNSSLTTINEAAVRHDVRLAKELGYWGTLLVTECGTTDAEMRDVVDIAVAEAKSVGLRTIMLGSFPTLETTIEMVRYAETAGADLVLLSYPLMFHPGSNEEVFAFTKAVADATDLGVFLFCVNQWDFAHLHPSGFDPALIRRIVDEIDTVVAVKNEIGGPGVGGLAQVFHDVGHEVVVTDPFEMNAPAWVSTMGMQFMGTSNYEYLGAAPVQMFEHLRAGRMDEAMAIYWQVHPARQANAQASAGYMPGGGLVHRQLWKYQAWLNGFNGGPVRQPHLRLGGGQRRLLRDAHQRSGLDTTSDDDRAFYVGRCPME